VKIVHLTWGLAVGGAETMLVDIANEQAVAHETWIIVGNEDVDPAIAASLDPAVRLRGLGRPPGSTNPWHLMKLVAWLWQIKADVVHAHQESFGRLKRPIPAPLLLTVHNTRLPLSDKIHAFDSICCISQAVRDDVASRFPPCRPRVIHNGINFRAMRVKARYGGKPTRIVQVSRLAHLQKGQDLLIRSLRTVVDVVGADAVRLDFIGEGESLEFLQRLAAECGVERQCRFLGLKSRPWIYGELQAYDLLVQPSRYEGFGLTIIEGIAAGLPVLVSDIEGPWEIIANGELGWSFRSENVEDLSGKILEIIAISATPHFATAMRARIEKAKTRFDVQWTAQHYLEEYTRMAAVHE
jgi:glycosyltransferase involved in cell wall biosynthesis